MDRTETGGVAAAADLGTMPRKEAKRRAAASAASMDGDVAAANLAAYLDAVEAGAATLIRQFPDDRPAHALAAAAAMTMRGFPARGIAPGEREAAAFMRVATELAAQSGSAGSAKWLPRVADLVPINAETRAEMTNLLHAMLSWLGPRVVVPFRTARLVPTPSPTAR